MKGEKKVSHLDRAEAEKDLRFMTKKKLWMLLSSNDDYWRVLKGATWQNEGANTRRIFALWLCILRQVFIVRASKNSDLYTQPSHLKYEWRSRVWNIYNSQSRVTQRYWVRSVMMKEAEKKVSKSSNTALTQVHLLELLLMAFKTKAKENVINDFSVFSFCWVCRV